MQTQDMISCQWKPLRNQLLKQWGRLSVTDLEEAGPDHHRIAQLITRKYGISAAAVEDYLNYFKDNIILHMG